MGASLVYLDRPNTTKATDMGQFKLGYKYATSSMQGWRLAMEDAHIINDNIDGTGAGLFAIFDGHGGFEVAKFCERHFTNVLINSELYKQKKFDKALEEAFLQMDVLIQNSQAELLQIHNMYPAQMTPLKRAS